MSIIALLFVAGCGGSVGYSVSSTTPVTPPPANQTLNGNWQFATTTTSGSAPFALLTGSVAQGATQTNGTIPVNAILQTQSPDSCYLGQTAVPLQGTLASTSLSLISLSDVGQYLTVTAASSNSAASLNGSFSISGGCADGVKGTLSGVKIASLSGSYSGTWNVGSSARSVTLTLTQDSFSDGLGYFHVQGSGTFTGETCFSGGSVQLAQSEISGQQVQLTMTTNETTPSTVVLSGTVDPTGRVLTLSSITVLSGGCSGDTGSATLSS